MPAIIVLFGLALCGNCVLMVCAVNGIRHCENCRRLAYRSMRPEIQDDFDERDRLLALAERELDLGRRQWQLNPFWRNPR